MEARSWRLEQSCSFALVVVGQYGPLPLKHLWVVVQTRNPESFLQGRISFMASESLTAPPMDTVAPPFHKHLHTTLGRRQCTHVQFTHSILPGFSLAWLFFREPASQEEIWLVGKLSISSLHCW